MEAGSVEVGTVEVGTVEVGAVEVGAVEVEEVEVGAVEVATVEVGAVEVGAVEVGAVPDLPVSCILPDMFSHVLADSFLYIFPPKVSPLPTPISASCRRPGQSCSSLPSPTCQASLPPTLLSPRLTPPLPVPLLVEISPGGVCHCDNECVSKRQCVDIWMCLCFDDTMFWFVSFLGVSVRIF